MAFEFHLPDIGEGLTEATIVSWRVPVGGRIGLDEPMVEIETDKAIVEIPAPRPGVVLHHGAPAGATIAVESLLVVIGDEGEAWTPSKAKDGATIKARAFAKPIVGDLEEGVAPAARPGRPRADAVVRRLAASLGVDLASVRGSGPEGRIVRTDVEAAMRGAGPVERVRMSPTRLAIARNLTRSWQEIPHVTTFGTADPEARIAAPSRRAAARPKGAVGGILIPPPGTGLRPYTHINTTVDGEYLVLRKHYDVGVAVDTPEGLMVAVVRAADTRDIAGLSAEIIRLAGAARGRTIITAELRGATFTVSNIGAVGGGFGTPIIPYGTTAILSVGRAEDRAVVRAGSIAVGRELPLSLSYDHRVIDGARGRVFLAAVVAAIEGI